VDWFAYWFMLPALIMIAAIANFSGISGAALMMPLFLVGFPLLSVPRLSTVGAIGAALFIETSGFGTGVYHYRRLGLAEIRTARSLLVVTVPLALAGALLAHQAPATLLRLAYGLAMLGVAWLLFPGGEREPGRRASVPCPCLVCDSECATEDCPEAQRRELHAANGATYRWCPRNLGMQRVFSGMGALLTGLISTGVGESTLPTLVRRSRLPVPVAAATSTFVVAGTAMAAALAHLVELARAGGFAAIPWNLIVWGVPGAIIGATIGTHLQGRVSERSTRLFFSALFLAIGVTFLLAFTAFSPRFA
jgi:uncharacterized membrane protein YfcA